MESPGEHSWRDIRQFARALNALTYTDDSRSLTASSLCSQPKQTPRSDCR